MKETPKKIAFDMDGVIRQSALGDLNLICQIRNKCQLLMQQLDFKQWLNIQSGTLHPLLNPLLFANPEDEIYVITACPVDSLNEKREWIQHFFGDRIEVIGVTGCNLDWGKQYVDYVAEKKFEAMKIMQITTYFDDDIAIVRKIRELADKAKYPLEVWRYSPWIHELY